MARATRESVSQKLLDALSLSTDMMVEQLEKNRATWTVRRLTPVVKTIATAFRSVTPSELEKTPEKATDDFMRLVQKANGEGRPISPDTPTVQ